MPSRVLLVALMAILASTPALAGVVAGTVRSSASGEAIFGAEVLRSGTPTTTTDTRGVFQLTAGTGEVIRIVAPGYISLATHAGAAAETLTFALAPIWQIADITQIYTDLPAQSWYTEAVQTLYEHQIIGTQSATAFRPSDTVSRAELAQFAVRLAGFLPPEVSSTSFCDVAPTAWYARPVEFMYSSGWIRGFNSLFCDEQREFQPDSPVSRAEALKMLLTASGDAMPDTSTCRESSRFGDVSPSDWFAPFVGEAACLGVVHGYADGSFHPYQEVKRAELAVIIAGLLQILATE